MHFIHGNIGGLQSIQRVEVETNKERAAKYYLKAILPRKTKSNQRRTAVSHVRADLRTELSPDSSILSKETVHTCQMVDTAPFAIARNAPVKAIMPNNSLIDKDDDLNTVNDLKFLLTEIFRSAQQRSLEDDLCSILSLNALAEDVMNPITF